MWYLFIVDSVLAIKKKQQPTTSWSLTDSSVLVLWRPFPHPVRRLHLSFNVCFHDHCIGKQFLMSTRSSSWSSVSKCATNFALAGYSRRFFSQNLMEISYIETRFVRKLLGKLNDDFHESQRELSRRGRGRRLLMWTVSPGLEYSSTGVLFSLKSVIHFYHWCTLIQSSLYACLSNCRDSVECLRSLM